MRVKLVELTTLMNISSVVTGPCTGEHNKHMSLLYACFTTHSRTTPSNNNMNGWLIIANHTQQQTTSICQ